MAITRNPKLIGISDPNVLKTVEGQLYKAAVIANGHPTVKNSELILPFTTVATGPKLVNIATNSTNEAGDVVTVYSAQGNVYVSSIDQTIRNTTVNQVGVTTIVAGNNITISSTSGAGTGVVTINSTGGGAGDPGGATTQIQFNNAGTFGGTANITWTGTNFRVNTPSIQLGNAAGVGQGLNAVAVGAAAGASNQGANAIAVGYLAGYTTQGIGAVAVGRGAGNSNQNANAVAVGTSAGATTQGNSSVALGVLAGSNAQGNLSVAIGVTAGQFTQGDTAVAIGYYAGNNTQGGNSVAIGSSAGSNTQGNLSVAIGANAAFSNQGVNSIAIGANSGYELQGNSSVAVGYNAGYSTQGIQSVAIGYYAGLNTQGVESVAIGSSAGHTSQGGNSVAIGSSAGTFTQGENSVAIGPGAGTYTQGANAVAIGSNAGNASQANNSIVINATGADLDNILANSLVIAPIRNDLSNVANAIYYNTATKEVSYGPAGSGGIPTWDNLGDKNNAGGPTAIALGRLAGSITPGTDTVAIGSQAGYTSQGDNGLAIGRYAGYSVQGQTAVAIGGFAGYVGQGGNSVAVGSAAGTYMQGINSVAVGHSAGLGFLTTKSFVSTVGTTLVVNSTVDITVDMRISGSAFTSGQYVTAVDLDGVTLTISAPADSPPVIGATLFFIIGQSSYSVAIGAFAGAYAQGANSIAIGANAGYTSQANNSVVINATGIDLDNTTENSLVIAPIRNDLSNVANALYYNTATKEVSYGPAAVVGTPSMIANGTSSVDIAISNGNVVTTAGANIWTFSTDGILTIPGNIIGANVIAANFFSGDGSNLSNVSVAGANVSGEVGFAAVANSVAGANVSGEVGFAATANAVAGANVSGEVGFAAVANAVAGANVSGEVGFAAVANAVAGANVSGEVANSTYAVTSGTSYSVAGANVSGEVGFAAVSNSVAVGNVSGIGNIATTNLDGNASNVLYGNGSWSAISISIISNGTSNVSIPVGSSNVNLTAAGNTTLVITDAEANITGAVYVSGGGSFGANVNLNSNYITSLHDPVTAQDAATKNYVDTVASGLHVHQAAYVATIGNLDTATSGTVTYNNGASGVGANLVTTGTFYLIDGGNVQTAGTRILVKNEANQVWNGVYTYDSTTTIIRATDFDTAADVVGGDFLFVTSGATLADTGWVQTTDNVVIGTSNIVFDQFSGVGTYKAGTGLTLTGQVFSVNASQTQVTSVGTLTSLLVGNATANTTFGNGTITALGNVTAANFIGTLANGTSNISIPTSNGNIVITAGANAWTLGTTGTLTFPVNNATQQTITGTTQLIQGDPYPVTVTSNAVSTIWTASSANVTSAKIVLRVSYGAGSDPDNVEMLDVMIAKANTVVAFNVSNKLKTDDAWADTEIDVALAGSILTMTTANAQASGVVDVFYTYSATEFNTTYD